MSFRILFKGQVPDEFVEDSVGARMSQMWENGALTGRIRINDNLYEAGAIKAILSDYQNPDTDKRKRDNMQELDRMAREFNELDSNLLALPPEKRAKTAANLAFADLMFVAMKGRKMTKEDEAVVVEKSTEWLTSHPDFSLAAPTCYIPKKEIVKPRQSKHMPHISEGLQAWAAGFAMRVLVSGPRKVVT